MNFLLQKRMFLLSNIETKKLPSEYQEVEYIQREGAPQTNNCYIKTGVYSSLNTQTDTIEFELEIEHINDNYHHVVFGSNFGIQIKHINNKHYIGDPSKYISIDNKFSYTVGQSPTYNRYMIYGSDLLKHSAVSRNLEIFLFTMNGLDNGYGTITPGAQDYDGSNKDKVAQFNGKLYYCKVTKNNEVIREFIPCYRKQDGEIGLYDLIEGQFYSNDGTGQFSKGADV